MTELVAAAAGVPADAPIPAGPAENAGRAAVLEVADLSVAYRAGRRSVSTVRSVSFRVERGQTLALVGQSGSGKSTIANAVFRLLPAGAAQVSGRIRYGETELLGLTDEEFRQLRGRHIGYVPQDPVAALNPVRKIGSQLVESLRIWGDEGTQTFKSQAIEILRQVRLPDPERVFGQYPHQLSGGMLQRVLIGIAICARPKLLIADEPTSALDATVQHAILDLLVSLQREYELGILLITHDLSIARDRASSVVVLNEGQVVEAGPVRKVFAAPEFPYTRGLLADVPALAPDKYRAHRERHLAAPRAERSALEIREVTKVFGRGSNAVTVLDKVSLTVRKGSTHALVGESGSGKSTTARIVLRLEQQTSGSVFIDEAEITERSHRSLRQLRRNLQLVYQNPFTSLDPRFTVRATVEEPLRRYRIGDQSSRRRQAEELVASVGLHARYLDVRPQALSGGQRQRVAIARALAIDPQILILDEPTSALDVTVQAQILDLLVQLQASLDLTYLFISHDLSLVRQFADEVTVLRRGTVVESGPVVELFDSPREQYTRELLGSIPGRSAPDSGRS